MLVRCRRHETSRNFTLLISPNLTKPNLSKRDRKRVKENNLIFLVLGQVSKKPTATGEASEWASELLLSFGLECPPWSKCQLRPIATTSNIKVRNARTFFAFFAICLKLNLNFLKLSKFKENI